MAGTPLLLAGDIGGTKTTLALYHPNNPPGPPLAVETYANSRAAGLEQLVDTFLRTNKARPAIACFGAAGPIHNEQVELTNLNWTVSAHSLQQKFGFDSLFLINDLVATAMGAVMLPETDLLTINRGIRRPGPVAVIAPGTGLGEAFLIPAEGGYAPQASEGGHTSFAPRNRLQVELLEFLLNTRDHVSCEQVCSGSGIPNLFAFMQSRQDVPEQLQSMLMEAEDPVPLIILSAMEALQSADREHIALGTMTLFSDILADEAANLVLTTLSEGGLYIAGGLPVRMLPLLTAGRFVEIFRRGVYKKWLSQIPMHIVLNNTTAVFGAACYAVNQLRDP